MCGRYTNDLTWSEIHAFSQPLAFTAPSNDSEPAYNIAPTQDAWVLTAGAHGSAEARRFRWGLVPGWARDTKIAASAINARLETAATKPSFRSAWHARRCIVPASGYYEWTTRNGFKHPYWIHPAKGRVMAFAGLWESWCPPGGDTLHTFSILTREAPDAIRGLHDRAPVMLSPSVLGEWLQGSAAQAADIAGSAPMPDVAWHRVGDGVGNVRHQGRELILPVP